MLIYAGLSRGHIIRRLIPDRIGVQMWGLSLQKNHKFFDILDRKCQNLFEAGIIDRLLRNLTEKGDPKRYAHLYKNGPKVLTLEHLEAGFIIWLTSLSFTLIAFISEWIIKIVEFTLYKSILGAFYERKMNLACRFAVLFGRTLSDSQSSYPEICSGSREDKLEDSQTEIETLTIVESLLLSVESESEEIRLNCNEAVVEMLLKTSP